MLLPRSGGADDSRSVFVVIKNTHQEAMNEGEELLFPLDVSLAREDSNYFASGRLRVDECIPPQVYGKAKVLSAIFWAD